jgi:hypothetical protein
MRISEQVDALAAHLEQFVNRSACSAGRTPYGHMGATVCDSILQAGLNYRTVVYPRVLRILTLWPSATTTPQFADKVRRFGLANVLSWKHPEKLDRIHSVIEFLEWHNIETEACLGESLRTDSTANALRRLPGIGPKTIDYLKMLVGVSTLAVDRHVATILTEAGIRYSGNEEAHALMTAAAERMALDRAVLDVQIWMAMSTRTRGRPPRS